MTAPWRTVALQDVATIERDSIEAADIHDGTLYVGLENIQSGGDLIDVREVDGGELESSKFSFTPRHLLYGKLRPYLAKIARPTFEGICSTDILPVLPGPHLDRDFLAHFLLRPESIALATSRATGANLPRLSPRALADTRLPLPPLAEQRRTAEILNKADALRNKRRAALDQLNTLSQSIFLSMFGDPATNENGWDVAPLARLVRSDDTINYGVVQPGDDVEEGVPLIRVGDLVGGKVRRSGLKRISSSIEAAYKRSRLRGDEILVSCVGSIGAIALADESVRGFNIARAVARIPLGDTANRLFIAAYLNTHHVQRYFINELRTVSQPTLNIKQISETIVVLPPIELQIEFARRAAALERLKSIQLDALTEIDALFSSLQHRAFQEGL